MERAAVPSGFGLLLLFLWCCLHGLAAGQTPIPARYDGFVYPGGGSQVRHGGSILVEAFFDPLCPDSRDAWPPLKRALRHYHHHVSLIVHPFAPPYHPNAFFACRALHIARNLNASATYPLLDSFFKHQEKYYSEPTKDLPREAIINDIAHFTAKVVGHSSLSAIKAGYNNSQIDMATRISFKYACSRGATGTPSFFVNGIPIPGFGSPVDYKTWRSIIDPLLQKQ